VNTEKQVKTTVRDFLISGLQDGHIGETELAEWIVEGLTHDTDAVTRLNGEITQEQADYILDLFEEEDRAQKHEELIKLDRSSNISSILRNEYEE